MTKKFLITLFIVFISVLLLTELGFAEQFIDIPDINIQVSTDSGNVRVADSVQILVLLTILTLAPSILIMMTTFTRFIIVLGFVRRALALQTSPPNQTLIGLALFMTLFSMSPVFTDVYNEAYVPLKSGEISSEYALEKAKAPIHDFMLRQVRTKDLALFMNIDKQPEETKPENIPFRILVPAFILSELKLAFEIGFIIFMPFIVIDMIVSSTLMALGMMMLPPVMLSLPIKILLFIMVDGWNLIVEKLILSVR